ncbi:MAG: CopG family transcriptional regulator [Candidatus Omnitrophica bacterium]|nr:CopG family transcriptional regulator [Candidatus Omnitrophota bacterium]MDE2215269.1 CopG family transcriptional regulator [Candidatus Omnitrophota bacterium]
MIKRASIESDMPIGELKQIKDFLPPPHQLTFPEDTVKVTISLTKKSLNFFKREAAKNKIKYQKMIRAVVDRYAKAYEN